MRIELIPEMILKIAEIVLGRIENHIGSETFRLMENKIIIFQKVGQRNIRLVSNHGGNLFNGCRNTERQTISLNFDLTKNFLSLRKPVPSFGILPFSLNNLSIDNLFGLPNRFSTFRAVPSAVIGYEPAGLLHKLSGLPHGECLICPDERIFSAPIAGNVYVICHSFFSLPGCVPYWLPGLAFFRVLSVDRYLILNFVNS